MSDLCSKIVERFGDAWGYLGWIVFAGRIFGPLLFLDNVLIRFGLVFGVGLALLVWWAVDAADQQLYLWVAVAPLFIIMSVLPYGFLLVVIGWVLYWTRSRE